MHVCMNVFMSVYVKRRNRSMAGWHMSVYMLMCELVYYVLNRCEINELYMPQATTYVPSAFQTTCYFQVYSYTLNA